MQFLIHVLEHMYTAKYSGTRTKEFPKDQKSKVIVEVPSKLLPSKQQTTTKPQTSFTQEAEKIRIKNFQIKDFKSSLKLLPTHYVNPFTSPACKMSGLKDAQLRLQTVYIPVI